MRVDPDWEPKDASVSVVNDIVRMMLDRVPRDASSPTGPTCSSKVVPTYPPGAKRMLRDNGVWAAHAEARQRAADHRRRSARSRRTASSPPTASEHEVDVIIYGTGFQASKFLTPMKVTGRGGVDLHEQWDGDARAYLGVTVPGFPNLFCLYGPNTNIVINGSIIYFSECGVRYILGCIEHAARGRPRGARRAQGRARRVQRARRRRERDAWRGAASDVNSWYKNEHGHVAQNWPFTLLEYWQRTLRVDPDDYEFLDG